MPDLPSLRLVVTSSVELPRQDTMPMPVITTRLILFSLVGPLTENDECDPDVYFRRVLRMPACSDLVRDFRQNGERLIFDLRQGLPLLLRLLFSLRSLFRACSRSWRTASRACSASTMSGVSRETGPRVPARSSFSNTSDTLCRSGIPPREKKRRFAAMASISARPSAGFSSRP